jgi:hypothetical protein
MKTSSSKATSRLLTIGMRRFLPIAVVIACGGEASAQTATVPSAQPPRTLAFLLAEGYEIQTIRLFQDKIWMRKPDGQGLAFICDRGRIGSPAFEAYRKGNYGEVLCSPAP